MVITATGVTPEMVRVDFLIANGSFFITNISVTKSGYRNKRRRKVPIIKIQESRNRSMRLSSLLVAFPQKRFILSLIALKGGYYA